MLGLENDLIERITADPNFGISKGELNVLLKGENFIGRAPEQVEEFISGLIEPILSQNAKELGVNIEITV